VQTLTDTGILDNTVIIYTTDHGFFLGEHRIPFGKYWPYEEALRTPLIIRGPGIPAGQVRTSPVVNVDLAPTILDLAHASSLRVMDGRSLVPLMKDPTMVWTRDFLLEGKTGNAVPYEGVHTDRYVYIEYKTGDRELYDLQTDPHELNNLAHWATRQSLVASLHDRLLQLEHCSGVTCQSVTISRRRVKSGAASVIASRSGRAPGK
jgi:arylsulfatase A-like enzyme